MSDRYSRCSPANPLINSAPFFQGLTETAVEKATAHLVTRTLKANEVILLEKDWGSSVYFILSGWVKIRTINADGKEVTLNILGKGELFGEMAALNEASRSTDVITLTTTERSQYASAGFCLVNSDLTPGGSQVVSAHGATLATIESATAAT